MRAGAIIVAAGRGLRLGGPVPKQYQRIGGAAVLTRTLRAALACPDLGSVTVAIHPDFAGCYAEAVAGIDDPRLMSPVHGGAERADTVRLALDSLAPAPDVVLIHDAARPFASAGLWSALIAAASGAEGAIAAEPVVDALWRETDGRADAPVPRAGLWRAQTPQAFPFAALLAAHRDAAAAGGPPALDDAEVFRRAGGTVRLIAGEPDNFKITTADDLARAGRLVAAREAAMDIRIGHGFDVHRFCEGDHVTLCGVRIPHERGLLGHSDADVGLHALADAIYGALAEGDIGTHFPPSDPKWKGAPSHIFLAHAAELVRTRGGRIANVDVTLLAERPKIVPHAAAMRETVGRILGIAADRVGIKATTMERMGFVGREEGMAAIATATVILGEPA
ncbi:bifunctional 2-C-methyl-D-erythritol 4-phosphate cytidylyltransferase/2-C-methyl-D-erythritol 2,4-cyclodiphosphate synthase [Limibaculum sp. FT325]|uniref:bifunctional 2-C-methyl-D-erythritol 4-phosphate cytidylyltransferase/2-C-methyl-D-erythritol 2,4-cyclodiphosphate synthase n=1 Tax=Thermohalobaculum sediminis TaxID=2939436 RepID=UPI0020C07BA4|nr:bifunctional 2-C-methyl-D-erythritol 4-phosphate cytidylyltransferase/2-C-methyl-D-erythritol 2,4-cyclodiphosphate synthase [Limibaculum sediminis]MCL5778749.1 bifunctional 2-C-methyl-D-erythritol 4-phosphate cytidylyltransferase/2-C-methyl-D-erythritol 2,4-cyclodiphosphate synthase [Limibaculum sediminis]